MMWGSALWDKSWIYIRSLSSVSEHELRKFWQYFYPPPPLPENPVYVHQSDHCPRPVINIKKTYRYTIQIYLFFE